MMMNALLSATRNDACVNVVDAWGQGTVEISKGIISGILSWSATTRVLQLKDFIKRLAKIFAG